MSNALQNRIARQMAEEHQHADPRDVAENAVALIDLGELACIFDNFRRNCDLPFARASLAIAARRTAERFHLGEREE